MSKINELIQALCPDGVEWKTLGEVAFYPKNRISVNRVSEANYVGVDNLLQNRQGKTLSSYVPTTGNLIEFKEKDVLIGNIRPYLKKIWFSNLNGGTNGDVLVLRLNEFYQNNYHPKFLYHLLASDHFFDYNMQFAKGAKMPRGDKDAILRYPTPIPPLPIQNEIVYILDLFTQLEAELEAELEARKTQYTYYRDELLNFEGKEVEWKTLDAISKNLDSKRKPVRSSDRKSGQYPYYGASGIVDYVIDYIFDGDYLLISEDGANLLARNTPIAFSISGKTWVNNHAHVLQFDNYVTRRLVEIYLNSIDLSKYISGAAQPKLNKENLNKIPIPIPPLSEQERIVSILDKFDALVNDLSSGLPAEIKARRQQYEYYRNQLLTFKNRDHG